MPGVGSRLKKPVGKREGEGKSWLSGATVMWPKLTPSTLYTIHYGWIDLIHIYKLSLVHFRWSVYFISALAVYSFWFFLILIHKLDLIYISFDSHADLVPIHRLLIRFWLINSRFQLFWFWNSDFNTGIIWFRFTEPYQLNLILIHKLLIPVSVQFWLIYFISIWHCIDSYSFRFWFTSVIWFTYRFVLI